MTLNIKHFLPSDFHPQSKVWIYQSSRKLSDAEVIDIEKKICQFASNWMSHADPVKGFAKVVFNWFIILIADESRTKVSGCSTDSSVRLIKEIEQTYHIDLFNRTLMTFFIKESIQPLPMVQVQPALQHQMISPETLFFDNTILTKQELEEKWIVPLKNSWLYKKIA